MDLLHLVRKDPTWQLILTCRDYSADLVRSSMLQFAGVSHSVLEVPLLNDEELTEVALGIPELASPLSNPSLRKLLRNPYILDKATQMAWPIERSLPVGEKEFRDKFWREVIRVDDRTSENMPRRRQDTLVEISLRRARALSEFVPCQNLDGEAVQALHRESLVSFSPSSDALVAPAHDVLEDWAILGWIEEQYVISEGSLQKLAGILGTYPAIRRTYRKWVFELVESDTASADRIFEAVLMNTSLTAQFRDDTLVSLLKSGSAPQMLERHASKLFDNDRELLRRIIHLLRVGCVKTPEWFGGSGGIASLMNVPDGIAWQAVLKMVQSNLSKLEGADALIILGLIEDASRGVNWQSPYPAGASEIVKIAHWLLPRFDGYRSGEQRNLVLQILAKLPSCDVEQFTELLIGSVDDKNWDAPRDDFRKLILWDMHGMPAARDLPDLVIKALSDELLLTVEEFQGKGSSSFGYSHEIEPLFGLKGHGHSFPSSALHGPYSQLLRYHPTKAIDFLIDLFNHSAEWYSARRVPMEYVEEPYEITLVFADGSTKSQWCNSRLWKLYRGTSVGPYVLQSALMALENHLLEVGESKPSELDDLLISILKRSESAAITAVVAATSNAYPKVCPETVLALLSSRDCIRLDRTRFGTESQADGLAGMMLPMGDGFQRIYNEERKKSNLLSHRKRDLEAAVANVGLTKHAARVNKLIDLHLAAMPPVDEQNDDDRVWRLALHRMDLRKYTVATPYQSEDPTATEDEAENAGSKVVRYEPEKADSDVEAMVEESQKDYAAVNKRMGLTMWGMKVFKREESETYDPAAWQQVLEIAQAIKDAETAQTDSLGKGGPEYVATVCLRDHFDELSDMDLSWCVETICDAVEESSRVWDEMERVQRYEMAGDRPSAWILSALATKSLTPDLQDRVAEAFASAVLHPIKEVRNYASSGVGQHLWSSNSELAIHTINVLAAEAKAVSEQWEKEKSRPFAERREHSRIEYG